MDPHPAGLEEAAPHGSLAHNLLLVRPGFDALFYAAQYNDIQGDAEALLLHFCERGWREGRAPHAGFDTLAYLAAYPDVAQVGWNPFYHYMLAGQHEGRQASPATLPRMAAAAMFGHDPGDWVKLMRAEVDQPFYAAQIGHTPDGSIDLVAHFAYRGWLEERDPNPSFSVRAALAEHPHLRDAHVNPLLAAIVQRPVPPRPHTATDQDDPGIGMTRFPRELLFGIPERLKALADDLDRRRPDHAAAYADPVERIVAAHLDPAFYTATYADVREAGMDAVAHYCQQGWAERRNPTSWFDTAYYLDTNTDIAGSGVNPFWHYLVAGREEGRKPHRPGGHRRDIIEHAVDPDTRVRGWGRPDPVGLLTHARVERILRAAIEPAAGLVLSLSHDCYVRVTGGIQLFIADEQARYARLGMVYLHLSPFVPLLRMADPQTAGCLLNMVIDGRYVGVTSYEDLTSTLLRIERRPTDHRLFLVHCLLGHHLPDLIALQRASLSTANAFWVHDYSSICLGYTLLRNDVSYCRAPPPDSVACRVCVYGESRPQHLADMRALFEAVPFNVVAPSQAALRIWLEHANLPYVSAVAHEHCRLVPTDDPAPPRDRADPVRVAFIGYARPHKGWPLWLELVSRTKWLGAYEFVHLGSQETTHDGSGLRHYVVQTSAGHPDAMSDAVRELQIDLVLVLSTWPETFSYVTYEAMAGGADVVCLEDSGNVADTVLRRGRGVVASTEASLFAFFGSLRAVEYVRLCREQGSAAGQLVRDGTTATLQLAGA